MTQLGHLLRGGTPSAYDRVIATRFGIEAIDAVDEHDFGVMVALRGTDVIRVPLEAGVAKLKTVDQRLFDTAAVFFG
jgi:6-phosphofructokinase 1